MKTLFDPSIYDDVRPVDSYWEATVAPAEDGSRPLEGEQSCDIAVIGGGYTGLSAALHLARDYGADVRVLEAGHIGWGASGRNGGFCCLAASKLSIKAMIARYGLAETKRFYAAQLEGIELVHSLAEDEGIDYDRQGDGNLTVAHHPSRLKNLEQEAEALTRLFGIPTRLYSAGEFAEIGHDSTEQFGALHTAAGFALHPLKFLCGLARAAGRRGAVLHPHSRVLDWQRRGGKHRLSTAGGQLSADRVIVATNGFTRDGLHPSCDGRVLPAISNIATTRPLTDDELAAQSWRTENPICNTRQLLFYYRLLADRRFLFGARGDSTGRPRDAEKIRAWLVRRLGEVFPHWKDVPISHFWRGLVCFTRDRTPAVGRLEDDPSVWYGFGYQANGVNTAPWTGRALARLIAGREGAQAVLPAVMSGPAPRFPFAALRLWYLRGAWLYYRMTDDLGRAS
jgi:glycine/D-amino acid oxidase-like deaminating enzyme